MEDNNEFDGNKKYDGKGIKRYSKKNINFRPEDYKEMNHRGESCKNYKVQNSEEYVSFELSDVKNMNSLGRMIIFSMLGYYNGKNVGCDEELYDNFAQFVCDEDYDNFAQFVSDENSKYNYYEVGDLVFVYKYRYRNGTIGKNHIFLIIDKVINEKIIYLGMIISSKIEKIRYKANKMIEKDDSNNLRVNSIIKTDTIYKIFTKNILLKIGNIDKTKVEMYKSFL